MCSNPPVRFGQARDRASADLAARPAFHTSHLTASNLIGQIKCELLLLTAVTGSELTSRGCEKVYVSLAGI